MTPAEPVRRSSLILTCTQVVMRILRHADQGMTMEIYFISGRFLTVGVGVYFR